MLIIYFSWASITKHRSRGMGVDYKDKGPLLGLFKSYASSVCVRGDLNTLWVDYIIDILLSGISLLVTQPCQWKIVWAFHQQKDLSKLIGSVSQKSISSLLQFRRHVALKWKVDQLRLIFEIIGFYRIILGCLKNSNFNSVPNYV